MKKHDLDVDYTELSGLTTPIIQKHNTKRKYFITHPSYFSVEINAHRVTYFAVVAPEGTVNLEVLHTWLQNSQTCENTFRSTRSISSICSSGVNFRVSQFLFRINKLFTLNNIRNHINERKLHFPKHDKVPLIPRNSSNASSIMVISKNDIKNIVAIAYEHVIELLEMFKNSDFTKWTNNTN